MAEPTRLSPGDRLESYTIDAPLGSGAMGEVFRARDNRLDRFVAIKCLFASRLDADARERFGREARLASALNHPHILTVHEAGEFQGRPYIVTELVDGGTLRDWARERTRSWRQVVDLLAGVADALAAAHEAGMVHRDVKPENILVSRGGYAKLADFGLAKLTILSPTDVTAETEPGMVLGTVSYMSPEQASGGTVDARSDIFSFGVVLYELLAGARPFGGQTSIDVLHAIAHRQPAALPDAVPPALRFAVTKALEKDPADRYQSMRDLAVDLRRLVRLGGEFSSPAVRWWWKWAAAGALLMIIGVALWIGRAPSRNVSEAARSIKSLAVLPLRNLSSNPDHVYFADGLTEALTTSLAQVGPLKVIARSSAARYQGTVKSPTEIARELRVDALVDGSVERSGDRVRITTQLIDGTSAHLLWAMSYDRNVRDALALQSEVTRTIADEISVQLTSEQRERLASTRQATPEAQDAYLKGLYWGQKGDYPKQHEQFKLATERDDSFGAAWAALSGSYSLMILSGRLSQKEGYPRVRAAVTRALALDPGSADAHGALGILLQYHDWNWEESQREFQTALRLNPNSPHRLWYADGLAIVGRLDDAVTEAKRAQALDPFNRGSNVVLSHALLFARRYDEVIDHARSLGDLDPVLSQLGDWLFARALQQKREPARAVSLLEPLVTDGQGGRVQGNPDILGDLGASYAAAGRRADALRVLDALETMRKQGSERPQSWHFVLIYAALGEKDRAFRYMDEAYAERPSEMMFLKVDPRIDTLRSDPRYKEQLRRMGLSE